MRVAQPCLCLSREVGGCVCTATQAESMAKFTDDHYSKAMALLKSLDFNSSDAIQLITLASAFGASLESVNKEVSNGSQVTS